MVTGLVPPPQINTLMSLIPYTYMVKSLGDYNKARSSTTDLKNIKWTKKNPADSKKPRKRSKPKISPTNILDSGNSRISEAMEKVYRIKDTVNKKGPQRGLSLDKKSQRSSVSNCKIKPGFKRPGR